MSFVIDTTFSNRKRNEAIEMDRRARFGTAALEILGQGPSGSTVLVSLADFWRGRVSSQKETEKDTDVWIFEIAERDALTAVIMKKLVYLRVGTTTWEIEKRGSAENKVGLWTLRAQTVDIR